MTIPFTRISSQPTVFNTTQTSEIFTLPEELFIQVFSWLKPHELVKASLVCQNFCRLTFDNRIWRTWTLAWGLQDPLNHDPSLPIYQEHVLFGKRLKGDTYWRKPCLIEPRIIHSLIHFNNQLVSGGEDTTLCMWNETCDRTVRVWHNSWVRALTVVKNHLFSGSTNGCIYKWSQTGKCLTTLTGHTNCVTSLGPFQGRLVSASFDRTIRIWETTGFCIQVINCGPYNTRDICTSLAVYHDILFFGKCDGDFCKWSKSETEITLIETLPDSPIYTRPHLCSFTVFNGYLVGAATDGMLRLSKGEKFDKSIQAHSQSFVSLTCYGGYLFSGGSEGTIRVWNPQFKCISVFENLNQPGSPSQIQAMLCFNQKLFVSIGKDTSQEAPKLLRLTFSKSNSTFN